MLSSGVMALKGVVEVGLLVRFELCIYGLVGNTMIILDKK